MRIIKRTEGIKCFIWHWITTYVRNNDVRVFYSWTSFLFFLCLLPFSQFHLGKCTWMPKSEQLGKSAKNKLGSWAAEKWQKSRLSSCLCLLFFACPHHSHSGNSCQRVQTFWAIKMLNFFISHSDMMHVNIPKSEGWLDWEQLAWLGLTNTSKTRWSTRYILFLLFPQTLNHDTAHCGSTGVHAWDYFSTRCSHSLKSLLMTSKPRNTLAPAYNPFFWGYGLSKQSIVC